VDVRVETVPPEVTLPLRHRVLRPHLSLAEMQPLAGERNPGVVHLAARTPDGAVVGTAVLVPEPFARMPDRAGAWRLRGMATEEGLRGRGIGERVLAEAIGQVARHGGGLLWCNARVPARRFYERAGFTAVGAVWDEPPIGPHVVMWREVNPADGATDG
jgi:predicted GNAT family N-acyltransferase